MVKLLRQARSWWQELCSDGLTASELANRHGVSKSYVSRVIRTNFLAPHIVQAIQSGEQPAAFDARAMLGLHTLPLSWAEQKQRLHIP